MTLLILHTLSYDRVHFQASSRNEGRGQWGGLGGASTPVRWWEAEVLGMAKSGR